MKFDGLEAIEARGAVDRRSCGRLAVSTSALRGGISQTDRGLRLLVFSPIAFPPIVFPPIVFFPIALPSFALSRIAFSASVEFTVLTSHHVSFRMDAVFDRTELRRFGQSAPCGGR